jgi:hypothetical protein
MKFEAKWTTPVFWAGIQFKFRSENKCKVYTGSHQRALRLSTSAHTSQSPTEPVQISLALNVYVLSHHTLPRASIHLKTRQEY